MAIESNPQELTVKQVRRTWRVELFSDLNLDGDYRISVWRETVLLNAADDSVLKQTPDVRPIVKKLSEFEAGDPVLSLASQISNLADEWDSELNSTPSPVEAIIGVDSEVENG